MVGSARLRESDIHPISPKTTAPQYQPIVRKKRKGNRVKDCSRDRAAIGWYCGAGVISSAVLLIKRENIPNGSVPP